MQHRLGELIRAASNSHDLVYSSAAALRLLQLRLRLRLHVHDNGENSLSQRRVQDIRGTPPSSSVHAISTVACRLLSPAFNYKQQIGARSPGDNLFSFLRDSTSAAFLRLSGLSIPTSVTQSHKAAKASRPTLIQSAFPPRRLLPHPLPLLRVRPPGKFSAAQRRDAVGRLSFNDAGGDGINRPAPGLPA